MVLHYKNFVYYDLCGLYHYQLCIRLTFDYGVQSTVLLTVCGAYPYESWIICVKLYSLRLQLRRARHGSCTILTNRLWESTYECKTDESESGANAGKTDSDIITPGNKRTIFFSRLGLLKSVWMVKVSFIGLVDLVSWLKLLQLWSSLRPRRQ